LHLAARRIGAFIADRIRITNHRKGSRGQCATPIFEQVRRPIFRDGLRQWRNYEDWLGRLKDNLGDALIRCRE
jgi:hypothetical protein